MGQHAVDQLADVAAQCGEGFDAPGMADGACQVHQIDPLQGEQIAFGDHAAQLPVLYQADVGNVSLGHRDGRVEGAGLRWQVEGVGGHQLADWLLQVDAAAGDGATQIAQGKDAQRMLRGVDDDDAADLLFVHQTHGLL